MVPAEDITKHIKKDIVEILADGGLDKLGEALQIIINASMLAERDKYLGAGLHERTETRTGHANGYKKRGMKTRVGELELLVPQTRDGNFYPNCLEKGQRSERALRLAVAEMYLQGVSTRKVMAITEQLCGFEISSTTVSNATAELDGMFTEWRKRALGNYAYVYLDARYEKVREGGIVLDQAVLAAVGVSEKGTREILGVSVGLSEAEVHWRTFLTDLQKRGLQGIELIISDDHPGLKAARKAIFPSIPWQRCQYHLQQNAQKYIPKQDMKEAVAADIRAVFNAPDLKEAERLLKKSIKVYEKPAPKLAAWMAENLIEGMTVFSFPVKHRAKIRTTNCLERVNREIKRRTEVVSIFPNTKSCLRLVTAVLIEISEDWQSETNLYLKFEKPKD